MDWKEIGRNLGVIAPALGSALANPAGAVVGMAGALVAAKLGVPATPHAVAQAIASNPEADARIAEAEIEIARVYVADVQDARKSNAGHPMTWILPLVLIGVWVWLTRELMQGEIPASTRDMFFTGYGSLTTLVVGGVAYWTGTSRGSAVKQDILEGR